MARKRLVSPEFFTHGALYDAEATSGLPLRVAFAGLWTQCDRRGLFRWRPRELKLAILPYDPVDFERVLDALEAHGFIERYEVGGKVYGRVPTFAAWQTFHPHEKPASDIPEPPVGGSKPTKVRLEPTNGGPEPDNVRPNRSVTVAVTGTDAVTTEKTKTSAASRRPAKGKSKTEPAYPHYPTPLCQALHAEWRKVMEQNVAYPIFRKDTAKGFDTPEAGAVDEQLARDTITLYRIEKDNAHDRDKPFFKPAAWATELPRLLRIAAMPLSVDGLPTEKAALIFGGKAA